MIKRMLFYLILHFLFISNAIADINTSNRQQILQTIFFHIVKEDFNSRKIWVEQQSIKTIASSNDIKTINNEFKKKQIPISLTEDIFSKDSVVIWSKDNFPKSDSIASHFEVPQDEITIIRNRKGKIKSKKVKKALEVTIVSISNPIILDNNYALVTARTTQKISIGGGCSYLLHFNDGEWQIVQTLNCVVS